MANAGKSFFQERYRNLGGTTKPVTLSPSIRINTLKTNAKTLVSRLDKQGAALEKIPFTKHGYTVKGDFPVGSSVEYLLGYYYIQEAAAQLPAIVLNPQPDDTILDCCAAPGGKTTQMAQLMHNHGRIIAYELKDKRLLGLCSNLERMGITNTVAFGGDFAKVRKTGLTFDKVLLDAPCSGNYVTDDKWFSKRSLSGIQTSSKIQKRLLRNACEMLKVGGTLVYSTCSLEPEENELNMDWAINNLPLTLEKFNLPLGDPGLTRVLGQELDKSVSHCKRFWPHKTNTEGFFIAKLVKQ